MSRAIGEVVTQQQIVADYIYQKSDMKADVS